MRQGILPVILAMFILTSPLAVSVIAWDSDAADRYTVYGYVAAITDKEDNTPLKGVNIQVFNASNPLEPLRITTDGDGYFEFTATTKNGFMSIQLEGYAVKTLPSTMSKMEYNNRDVFAYDVNGITPDDEGRYALSSDASGDHPIAMSATVGNIYGQVNGDVKGSMVKLKDALVTLTNTNGRIYTAYTDDNGYFSIECPYGTYELNVTCSGFIHSETMQVDAANPEPYTVVMTMNVNTSFLGLDLPHAFEVIGIAVITLIMSVAFIIYKRTQNKHSEIVAIDYPDEVEEEEEFKP